MTRHADAETSRPKMIDLARKMDAAIRDVDAAKQAVDTAKLALDTATAEYAAAMDTVTALHQQYDALMRDVLSHGGTVHIAD